MRTNKLKDEPPVFLDQTPCSEVTVLDEKTGDDELLKALHEHHRDKITWQN